MANNFGIIDLDELDKLIKKDEKQKETASQHTVNFLSVEIETLQDVKEMCKQNPTLNDVWDAARHGLDENMGTGYTYDTFLDYINSSDFKK